MADQLLKSFYFQHLHQNTLKWFFNLNSEIFINYSCYFGSIMKNCVYFWKMLIVYQKRGILSKKIKISKGRNSAEFFLTFCVCVFLSTAYKKVFFVNRKSYFSESVDPEKTRQKQNKKIQAQVFRHC